MGLILDSSILIAAERQGQNVADLLRRILVLEGNQEAAPSAVALVELAHGIHRANTPQVRTRGEEFIQELLADVPVYPLTHQIALLAGKIDGERQGQGIKIPFQDLLIGATAAHLGYTVITGNPRHFRLMPGLDVKQL
ncbi:MAG TPA: PIN domain-containing protein [Candidatus Binatia bacterium]|nr:PIN domain-containing protein [Candidatus Binatia bacterium]